MKISLNWIKEYLPELKINSFPELQEKLVARGIDIESIEFTGEKFKDFVIGYVKEKKKHPDADKLSVCVVDIGGEEKQIVCGAPNVADGQKVCVAKVGAKIPGSDLEIKEVKIRGQLSQGMICSEKELELSDNHEGIMVLNENAKTGSDFADYIGANDHVLDIWVPPNRGDLSSHIGFARELASIYGMKVQLPSIDLKESSENTSDLIKISIKDEKACKRFTGRVIKNVKIGESPEWLKRRLTAVGLRPRNNIVDITNFVMMETGQPLHAFDYDKIKGKEIVVRFAREVDKFTTLDSKERILNSGSLMICDGKSYSGIAGVMGGEDSEITADTKNVFLEVAYFDPVVIRKNAKKLGLITDASQRFEKGVDINFVEYASKRATALIYQLAGGDVSKKLLDVYPERFTPLEVGVRKDRLNKLLGSDYSEQQIIESLDSVEIGLNRKEGEYLVFNIPEWRRYDIEREVDLIEEVSRLIGLDNLSEAESVCIDLKNYRDYDYPRIKFETRVKNYLIGRGFNEALTGSQQNAEKNKFFGYEPVTISNPHSAEMTVLRTNLFYGLINTVRNNVNNSGRDISLKLFEIGKVFRVEDNKITERKSLGICLAGSNDKYSFAESEKKFGYYDLKGEFEMLLSKLNLENQQLFYYYESRKNDGFFCSFKIKDKYAGELYVPGKDVLEAFDLDFNVMLAEIDLDVLYEKVNDKPYYKEIPKFPVVKRDISLLVDSDLQYEKIKDVMDSSGIKYLSSIKLFDVYNDKNFGDKLSMTFSLDFVSNEKTLTDEIVNKEVEALLKKLKENLNVTLRG